MEEITLLSESLTIATVADQRTEWRKTLGARSSNIRLIVDKLNNVDTAGLQLILALQKDATSNGKSFSISGKSEVLCCQARILGLTAALLNENSSREDSTSA